MTSKTKTIYRVSKSTHYPNKYKLWIANYRPGTKIDVKGIDNLTKGEAIETAKDFDMQNIANQIMHSTEANLAKVSSNPEDYHRIFVEAYAKNMRLIIRTQRINTMLISIGRGLAGTLGAALAGAILTGTTTGVVVGAAAGAAVALGLLWRAYKYPSTLAIYVDTRKQISRELFPQEWSDNQTELEKITDKLVALSKKTDKESKALAKQLVETINQILEEDSDMMSDVQAAGQKAFRSMILSM